MSRCFTLRRRTERRGFASARHTVCGEVMAAVFRAIFGYCFLILMIRIVGRRPGKQMTPFEYVLIFFIGGLTLTPLVGNDRSIVNAITIIVTIALTHYVMTWLRLKSAVFGRLVD